MKPGLTHAEDVEGGARLLALSEIGTQSVDLLEGWRVGEGHYIWSETDNRPVLLVQLVDPVEPAASNFIVFQHNTCEFGMPWSRYFAKRGPIGQTESLEDTSATAGF